MEPKIVKTRSGKFRVKYLSPNGKMLAHSEELNTKTAAKNNIRAMRILLEGLKSTDHADNVY